MLNFTLPWPDKDLSPNARIHWARLAKAKKQYRYDCAMIARSQLPQQIHSVPDGPLRLELYFIPPTRRSYDRDNLTARMKSGIDGLCDALKIDDKRFATVVVRMATDIRGGMVDIKITGDDDGSKKDS